MSSEVVMDLDKDARGHLDHTGPVRLRVPLDEVAPVLGQASLDSEAPEVVEVPPPQGSRLAGPQPAVGKH
jgi:hypothetical protein